MRLSQLQELRNKAQSVDLELRETQMSTLHKIFSMSMIQEKGEIKILLIEHKIKLRYLRLRNQKSPHNLQKDLLSTDLLKREILLPPPMLTCMFSRVAAVSHLSLRRDQ